MRLPAMVACAALAALPGLVLAPGAMAKSHSKKHSAASAGPKGHAPMEGAGSVGEGSATNGKTDNTGTAGNTGK